MYSLLFLSVCFLACVIVFVVCAVCIGKTTRCETPFPFMGCFFGMIISAVFAFILAIPVFDMAYKEMKRLDEQAIQKQDRP